MSAMLYIHTAEPLKMLLRIKNGEKRFNGEEWERERQRERAVKCKEMTETYKGPRNRSVARQGLGDCEILKKDGKMTLHRTKTEGSNIVIT